MRTLIRPNAMTEATGVAPDQWPKIWTPMPQSQDKVPRLFLLDASFIFMGIGTTILGPVLPSLSSHWGMNDAHAGALFTAQFLGSSLGAVLAALRPYRNAIAGISIAALGLLLLPLATPLSAFPLIFFYGLGVGLVLTGINLTTSNVAGEKRGVALSWLNFSWSLGATLCPLLVAFSLTQHRLTAFLALLAVSYAGMAALLFVHARDYAVAGPGPATLEGDTVPSLKFLLAYFGALLFLYVGVETTLGGWLSTLAERLPHASVMGAFAVSASSFFWLSLLVGRGVTPLLLRRIPGAVLQPAAIGLLVVSIGLLLAARSFVGVAAAGSLAGLSLAPVFPLSTSFYLARAGRSKSAGLVFAISGFGGAVLPWITGIVSSREHSLQWGLVVPWIGAASMLGLGLYYVLSPRFRRR
ncbi:MAG: MFS transporter [Acidobacteriaceae bacterium]